MVKKQTTLSDRDTMAMQYSTSIIKAPFHQASRCFSSQTNGRQCTTNCCVFLAYTMIKPVTRWLGNDLGIILLAGDNMCKYVQDKNAQQLRQITVAHIPTHFTFCNTYFIFRCRKTYNGYMIKGFKTVGVLHTLEMAFHLSFAGKAQLVIIEFCGSAVGVYRNHGMFYVFDPQSRSDFGMCNATGVSVLSFIAAQSLLCAFLRALVSSHVDMYKFRFPKIHFPF